MSIAVVGSLNMDFVMRVPHLPEAGETVSGHGFTVSGGGKGANQAIACARLGAHVDMIGCIGADPFGQQLRESLVEEGIDVSCVTVLDGVATGVATILVDDAGENCIALAPGANGQLTPAHLDAASGLIGRAQFLIVQLEVPVPTTLHAITLAAARGVTVLLNPAPAHSVPDLAWPLIDYLVPNETEASQLTGLQVHDPQSAALAARILRNRGVRHVLITLGAQGVLVADHLGERHLPAHRVKAVDTTAAGDAFIGGLAAGLNDGFALDAAARLGIAAASLCVTRHGAQSALPARHELPTLESVA